MLTAYLRLIKSLKLWIIPTHIWDWRVEARDFEIRVGRRGPVPLHGDQPGRGNLVGILGETGVVSNRTMTFDFCNSTKCLLRVQWACPERYAAHRRGHLASSLSGEFQTLFPVDTKTQTNCLSGMSPITWSESGGSYAKPKSQKSQN